MLDFFNEVHSDRGSTRFQRFSSAKPAPLKNQPDAFDKA